MENQKYLEFKKLHQTDKILVLPTAWDRLSAKIFEKAGFLALGTTSWGIAASLGYKDGEIMNFTEMLNIVKPMLIDSPIHISVDIESGYSENIDDILDNISSLVDLGAVGINIEDSEKKNHKLRPIEKQIQIIQAIKEKVEKDGKQLFVNARTDTYLTSIVDEKKTLEDTLQRGIEYQKAGADCFFIPGMFKEEHIKLIVSNLNIPINLIASQHFNDVNIAKSLGVSRLSLGSSLFKKFVSDAFDNSEKIISKSDLSFLFDAIFPDLNLKN